MDSFWDSTFWRYFRGFLNQRQHLCPLNQYISMNTKQQYQRTLQHNLAAHLFNSEKTQTEWPALMQMVRNYPSRSIFQQGINESELFKTTYYEDISDGGKNIEMRVNFNELKRILGTDPKKQGSESELRYFFDNAMSGVQNHTTQKSKKNTQYYMKTASHAAVSESLQYWLPYNCNVCKKYDTWEHTSDNTQTDCKVRQLIDFQSINLVQRLSKLNIQGVITCELQERCIFHTKPRLLKAATSGTVWPDLIESNNKADAIQSRIQQKLNGMRSVISEQTTYCMLRMFLMEQSLSCLELYFCIRKIVGESPLELDILEKVPMNRTEIAVEEGIVQEVSIVDVSYRPKISRFALSKSTVCDGAGVFATQFIRKGTFIGHYLGQIIDNKDANHQIRLDFQQKMRLSSYSFDIKDNIEVDSSFYGNFTRMLNHMPRQYANCMFKKQLASRQVALIATRDIQIGDELFIDYGIYYIQPWKKSFDKTIKQLQESNELKNGTNKDSVEMQVQVEIIQESEPLPPKNRNRPLHWCVKSGTPSVLPDVIQID